MTAKLSRNVVIFVDVVHLWQIKPFRLRDRTIKVNPIGTSKLLCTLNLAYLRQKCFMVLGHVHAKDTICFSQQQAMKFGDFGSYFMLFMPTVIVITSCTFHALFMPSSRCSWACINWAWIKSLNLIHINPILMRIKSWLDLMHMLLLSNQKNEHSVFMGMN